MCILWKSNMNIRKDHKSHSVQFSACVVKSLNLIMQLLFLWLFECSLFHENVFADLRNISPPQAKITFNVIFLSFSSTRDSVSYRNIQ